MISVLGLSDNRRKVVAAIVASLAAHIGVVLLVALLSRLPLPHFSTPPVEEPVEITILPPELPAAPEQQQLQFLQQTEEAPDETPDVASRDRALFEASTNRRAASQLPATGSAPLPTMQGEESDFLKLEDLRQSTDQQPERPARPASDSEAATEPVVPQPPAVASNPKPVATAEISGDIALLSRTPKVEPQETSTPQEKVVRAEPVRPARADSRVRLSVGGASNATTESRRTRTEGAVENAGDPSVDAVATPLGRYKQIVTNAIGSRWYALTSRQRDRLQPGTVRVLFSIDESGRILELSVVSNSSGIGTELVTLDAIRSSEVPPIPADIAATLDQRRMEIDFSFAIK